MKLRKLLVIPFIFFVASLTLTLGSCKKDLCTNTCAFNNDGTCDDGGEGSEYNVCDRGTDCADCGEREP